MPSNSMVKRANLGDYNGDRISDLPDGVIENILKRLPLHGAVRTSILSKSWRYKWLTIPYLVFDTDFEEFLPEKDKTVAIINRVLARHEGPITKFAFTCQDGVDGSIIQMWFKSLSNHPIEEFTLVAETVGKELVPKHFLCFDRLKHLSLYCVAIRLPHVFRGFSRLLTLSLDAVDIDSKDFNMLVSKCPALEVLCLSSYYKEPISLVIDAPNLKFFKFEGKFKSFVFENMNIEEISIWTTYTSDGLLPVDGSNLINFFGQFSYVRKLSCNEDFLKFLAKGIVPDTLPNYLNHMTTLEFINVDFGAMDHVTCLFCLIRSSPNLQSFEIIDLNSIHNATEGHVIEYLKTREKDEVSLGQNIKNITMNGFNGLEVEMAFVKVMLLKSMLLRKLIIKFPSNHAPKKVPQVEAALVGFHRASSEAVIEFGYGF